MVKDLLAVSDSPESILHFAEDDTVSETARSSIRDLSYVTARGPSASKRRLVPDEIQVTISPITPGLICLDQGHQSRYLRRAPRGATKLSWAQILEPLLRLEG